MEEKRDFSLRLNLLLHRLLGNVDGIRMTFGVRAEYIFTFAAAAAALIVQVLGYFGVSTTRFGGAYLVAAALLLLTFSIIKAQLDYKRESNLHIALSDAAYKQDVTDKLRLSKRMRADDFRILSFFNGHTDERYIASERCDEWLYMSGDAIQLERHEGDFRIVEEFTRFVPYVVRRALHKKGIVFNGRLVRLMQEPLPGRSALLVQNARYFDGQCTNELVYKKLRDLRNLETKQAGAQLLVDASGDIFSLDDSPCANYIGASTLAVTRDNYLIISRQGAYSKANAGRLAPSGSGSVSRGDLRHSDTLASLIITAMERELCEECNIKRASARHIRSRLIGYARLLERGGKPDFFGISYIDADAATLEADVKLLEKGLMQRSRMVQLRSTKDIPDVLEALIAENTADCRVSIQLRILCDDIRQLNGAHGDIFASLRDN